MKKSKPDRADVRDEENVLSRPHGVRSDVVAEALGVDVETGLSDEEAARRLAADGPNTLEKAAVTPWWHIFLRQFSSIVIWLLLAASAIALYTDSIPEAVAIFVVLLVNAVIGFAIEWRAGRALDALRAETLTNARVRRSGSERIIDAAGLVTGDIIVLAAGDRVPSDARLLEAANLQADESALTGESFPVTKTVDPVSASSVLTERHSMAYLGTMIVAGRGLGIVTGTGHQTEIGRVGQLLAKTVAEKTPLERRLESMGRLLVYLVLGIAAVVMAAGLLRGDDPALMLEVSISLAVAAIPEALPAMTTLILALGVLRMARNRAIVRKLTAVETLGSTTVICADKTGTLTENRMTVQEFRMANGGVLAAGDGRPASGELAWRLIRVSLLCNDASLDANASAGNAVGDPVETALLDAAVLSGTDPSFERARFERISEQPFDAVTKRMVVELREKASGRTFAAAKGAPGTIVKMCTRSAGDDRDLPIDEDGRGKLLSVNEEMASRGLRVLAFAEKAADEDGYTFLGFAGMSDPPREGVAEAIELAQNAGIRIVMLTGDQAMTARIIAEQLSLGRDGVFAMHASELIGAGQEHLAEAARRANVFARVSPEDKLRIVEALQATGEIVAVTGDGINDAPALKRADIGIAMGRRGTEVAKEAADIVLTDDNFATIIKAIEGGRTIYANIIKFVHMMFSQNLAEVMVIFVTIAAGFPLPLLPLQILWVNLVTDVFPAFALAVEPASAGTMRHGPRPPGEKLLSGRFLFLIGWQGALLAAITLAAYLWALDVYGEGSHSRTIALMALVAVQLGHTFNCRSRTRSVFDGFFSNPYMFAAAAAVILLQVAAVTIGPLAIVLGLTTPNWSDLWVIAGCVLLPILFVEITKTITRGRPCATAAP